MLVRIIRTIFGIMLLPLAFAAGKAFFTSISSISIYSDSLRLLERGALAYLVFHVFIWRPAYLYVWGHEMVHVLATWICGGKVQDFNVAAEGGGVITSKTNFFIELSPYFIPIYTLLAGAVYVIFRMLAVDAPHAPEIFLFVIGMTLAFHFVMTSEILRLQQPDILKSGYTFSFVFIFIGNIIIVMALFSPIFGVSFADFAKDMYVSSVDSYQVAWEKCLNAAAAARVWYNSFIGAA